MSDQRAQTLFESLAAAEHASWARWMAYLFSRCELNADGSATIPAVLVERWQRQVATPYADLSESEQESDRKEVREVWPLLRAILPAAATPDSAPAGRGE